MKKTFCNGCGLELDVYHFPVFQFPAYRVSNGDSIYYGCTVDVHLCDKCLEEMLDWMTDNCTYPPVYETDAALIDKRRLTENGRT